MSHVTFSLNRHVTFYKALTSLSTVFIKGHVVFLQLLKWPCHISFFTHVEPYAKGTGNLSNDSFRDNSLDLLQCVFTFAYRTLPCQNLPILFLQ